jgi:hypothetical protein
MNLLNELNKTQYVCCFCESEMDADQMFCCDTYKGKMTLEEFEEYYG